MSDEMLKDPRPIKWISWADGNGFIEVGQAGVTRIECYAELGQHCLVPWLAVYCGEQLWQRMDSMGKEIGYFIKRDK